MKCYLKRAVGLTIVIQILFSLCPLMQSGRVLAVAENMIGKQSQNEGMYGVPAPGEVTIDGNLDEWDWSGRIRMFANIDLAGTFSNETAVMYDDKNYYIGFKVKDPSPMESIIDPIKEGTWIWKKDSVQLRFITDKVMWCTFAYNHEMNRASLLMDYWLNENNAGSAVDSVIYYTDPYGTELKNHSILSNNPRVIQGLEIAYKKDVDEQGYSIEVKLPWELLYTAKPSELSGTRMQMGIEMQWGDNTNSANHEYKYQDNVQPGKTQREFFYTAKETWGDVVLSGTGNLTPREYSTEKERLMSGYFNADIRVPKEAKYITALVKNSKGKIVRNIVQEMDVKSNIKESFDEYDIVTILWDGRDNYGLRCPEGQYTIECITHEGIKPIFETTFYGPGNIPWMVADGTGGWGADHTAPISTSSNSEFVYIGWPMAEGGDALIALDKEGRKVWGENRGANIMAATDKYVYALPSGGFYFNGVNGDSYLMRLDAKTGDFRPFTIDGEEQKLEYPLSKVLGISNPCVPKAVGMAAYNNYVAIATSSNNEDVSAAKFMDFNNYITVVNGENTKMVNRIKVNETGKLAFNKKTGLLYMIDQTDLYEINIHTGSVTPVPIQKSEGFKMGNALEIDNDGYAVIMDSGKDCQLKAYDVKTGRVVYTMGQKGGRPFEGKWEKEGLTDKVSDIAVNCLGEIYAVESWEYPRRTSVWGKDGKLVRDYIGSVAYAASGAFLHDQTSNLAYVGPVEMKLDVEKQTYEITRILYVPDCAKGEEFAIPTGTFHNIQHFYSEASGQRKEYIFDGTTLYMEKEDGTFRPVFHVGLVRNERWKADKTTALNTEEEKTYAERHPKLSSTYGGNMYMWNDFNENGLMEDAECEIIPTNNDQRWYLNTYGGWGCEMSHSDMSWAGSTPSAMTVYKPAYFLESGQPVYTYESTKTIHGNFSDGSINMIEGQNKFIQFASVNIAGDTAKNNVSGFTLGEFGATEDWNYKNDFPGVHGSHSALIKSGNGFVIGTIKNLGFVKGGQNGEIDVFALRGNLGSDYFMTTDGFFVQTVFVDTRLPKKNLPNKYEDAIGMDLSGLSEGGEPFSGWMGTQDDGNTRLISSVAGRAAVVARIEGLETIKRTEPYVIHASRTEMDKAWTYVDPELAEEDKQPTDEKTVYEIKKADITVDGDINDWSQTSALRIAAQSDETANVRLAYNDEKLFAYFDVTDSSPMLNSGNEFQKLFKTGDVAEIQLSPSANSGKEPADGDMRLMISEMDGKPVAVMMKPKDKLADAKNFYNYSSPVGSHDFDTVKILDSAEVVIQKTTIGYTVEFAVPLKDIGLSVQKDMTITGDVGLITSDADGRINVARMYYFNKDTGLTNDLPGESWISPDKWGDMKFTE